MKKILILLILSISGLSFSVNCNWITEPDIYVRKQIELIKKNKFEKKYIMIMKIF